MRLLAVLLMAASCSPGQGAPPPQPTPTPAVDSEKAGPQRLAVKVISTRPHDTSAYTQGLVWHEGRLYESAGLYGQSSLRQVDPATGEVRRRVDLPQQYFAEGLARVGDRLIQITWNEGAALVYRLSDFQKVGELRYTGEGWGLCHDGARLVMSDGSDRLTFRDPETFATVGEVRVRMGGAPVDRLNELECVDGAVYANVYQTEDIVRIDPATGEVTAVIDASGLLGAADYQAGAEVLNGIAWMPETRRFLITGKRWPLMFEVELVPRP
jgi:glutamine cyclotransferase